MQYQVHSPWELRLLYHGEDRGTANWVFDNYKREHPRRCVYLLAGNPRLEVDREYEPEDQEDGKIT